MELPNKPGFTLIELLIVIAIILILVAIALPNFVSARTRASVSKLMSDMRLIAESINHYYADWNTWPNPYFPSAAPPRTASKFGNGAHMKESFLWIVGVDPNPGGRWNAERQVGRQLTTPSKYMAEIPRDRFWTQLLQRVRQGDTGTYGELNEIDISSASTLYWGPGNGNVMWAHNRPVVPVYALEYMLQSPGPNLSIEQGSATRASVYDPSNGINSDGDIYWNGAEYGFLGNGHWNFGNFNWQSALAVNFPNM